MYTAASRLYRIKTRTFSVSLCFRRSHTYRPCESIEFTWRNRYDIRHSLVCEITRSARSLTADIVSIGERALLESENFREFRGNFYRAGERAAAATNCTGTCTDYSHAMDFARTHTRVYFARENSRDWHTCAADDLHAYAPMYNTLCTRKLARLTVRMRSATVIDVGGNRV